MAEKSAAKSVEAIHRSYHGCSSLKEYELVRKLGEGTFGYVQGRLITAAPSTLDTLVLICE